MRYKLLLNDKKLAHLQQTLSLHRNFMTKKKCSENIHKRLLSYKLYEQCDNNMRERARVCTEFYKNIRTFHLELLHMVWRYKNT